MTSRLRIALFIAASTALACNAILGIGDVKLKADAGGGEADGGKGDAEPELDGGSSDSNRAILALGFNHACARTTDSTVKCWGDNGAGQIGDGVPFDGGARADVLKPQLVPGIKDALAIGSGLSHTCVVHKTGKLSCWGANFFGQLGDGTQNRSSAPVRVLDIDDAVDVVGGTSFTCARRKDATVWCWGANYSGQLGDGAKVDRTKPAPVRELTGAVGVAAATDYACAVLESGEVRCWGGNSEGQLGNGSVAESLKPAKVSSIGDIAQVSAAATFTCARQKSGKVYCWGNNEFGQLGNGSPNKDPNPSPILVPSLSDAVFVWTGYEHACAVRQGGSIVCWGAAGDGQLGKGSIPDGSAIASPVEVVGAKKAAAVWTGGNRSCSLSIDKSAYCWGINTTGQLGNGTRDRSLAAVSVSNFP